MIKKNPKPKAKSQKIKQYITKNTLMGEIVEKYPELIEVLTTDYGFHCFGCFAANMETLGDGAAVHGMGSKETKELLETLNGLIEENR